MSNTDSFMDEVVEEVRRDRLFTLAKRYGWIVGLALFVIVGGAAYNEWSKAQDRAAAQDLGDAILAAISLEDRAERAEALSAIEGQTPGARAILNLMAASEAMQSDPAAATTGLLAVADDPEVETIYRQIATLKAVMIGEGGLSDAERRERLDGLALGTGILRLLAEEQLAYMDVGASDIDGAIARLQQVSADAEATPGLRRRATQVIVALGGELILPEPLDAAEEPGGQ